VSAPPRWERSSGASTSRSCEPSTRFSSCRRRVPR
jgi:hypothetical protein